MMMTSQWTIKGKFFDLVVAPRTSLESLPSKETALPCTICNRSEQLHSCAIIVIFYYTLLNFDYYIKY